MKRFNSSLYSIIFANKSPRIMKLIYSAILIIFFEINLNAQVHLQKMWDHTYGGSSVDVLTELIQTSDGGFVLGGSSNSPAGDDISETGRGGNDYWIVRLDSNGNKLWDKRFGGSFEDKLYTVLQTNDGGFLIGGFTTSDSSGDITEPTRGGMDYWVVRTDANGNKLWDKRYGGSNYDRFADAIETPDNGFLIAGFSASDSSGDVTHNTHGDADFWILKTDGNGNIQWDQNYGGDQVEELLVTQNIPGGGYILGGRTASNISSDVSEAPQGDNDYWMIKITSSGTPVWDKRFGGNERDNFYDLKVTHNNGFILGGYIRSDMSGDVSEPTRDTASSITINRGDVWLVLTDSSGNKIWDKRFGGSWVEAAFGYVLETHDRGFMFGTASYSNLSGDKSENNFGYEQAWILKTDSNGIKLWDKTILVDGEDEFAYPLESSPGCYVIADWSSADSSSYKSENSRGGYDYWVIKFCETNQPQLPVANFTANYDVLCEGGCFDFINQSTNASSFQWFFPGGTPSSSTAAFPQGICYSDTGFHTVTLIASNLDGSDTITVQNAIAISGSPRFTIYESADTLFGPQGYSVYQWWYNGAPLPLETNYFTIATQNGDYVLTLTDSAGCFGSDTVLSFNLLVNEFFTNGKTITVYPNPATESIQFSGLDESKDGFLQIHDLQGRLVFSGKTDNSEIVVSVQNLRTGVYLVEIEYPTGRYYARFVKE